MIAEFFPLGIWHYAIGGLLVGLGTGFIYLMTGYYGGASGFFTSVWSFFSKNKFFSGFKRFRMRQLLFSVGLVLGGLLFTVLVSQTPFVTTVDWWRLLIGGFFVGIGTRMARGCTSGHGICGLSAWSPASLKAVITFMAVAIITAHLVEAIL